MDPGVSTSRSTLTLLELDVGRVMPDDVLKDTILAKVWVKSVSMPSASSTEVVEAALGLGSFAGIVKERRRPVFETVRALSGVEGAVEEDMMDEH